MKKPILITLCCASLMLVTPFTVVAIEEVNEKASNYDNSSVEVFVDICGFVESEPYSVILTYEEIEELKILFQEIRTQLKESISREDSEIIFKNAVVELERFGILGEYNIQETQSLVLGEKDDSSSIGNYINQKGDGNNNCLIMGETTNTGFYSDNPRVMDLLELLYWIWYLGSRIAILFPITIPLGLLIIDNPYLLEELYEKLYPILAEPLNKRISLFGNLFPFEIKRTITLGIKHNNVNYWRPSEGWVWTNGSNGVVEWEGNNLYGNTGGSWSSSHYYHPTAVNGFTGINIFIGNWIERIFELLDIGLVGNAYYFGFADLVKIENIP